MMTPCSISKTQHMPALSINFHQLNYPTNNGESRTEIGILIKSLFRLCTLTVWFNLIYSRAN